MDLDATFDPGGLLVVCQGLLGWSEVVGVWLALLEVLRLDVEGSEFAVFAQERFFPVQLNDLVERIGVYFMGLETG